MEAMDLDGVEPTLALGATIGCGWVALREGFLRLQDFHAAPRGAPWRWYDHGRSTEGRDLRD